MNYSSYQEKICNGCGFLEYEHPRKDIHTAHCLDPEKPVTGPRRTLHYSHTDIEAAGAHILRPVWCREKKERKQERSSGHGI